MRDLSIIGKTTTEEKKPNNRQIYPEMRTALKFRNTNKLALALLGGD